MLRLYSVSLGCPKNRVDSERSLGQLAAFGPLRAVGSPQRADIVFINTCAFIAPAVEESVRVLVETIQAVSSLPEGKRPLLVVAGCLVGRYGAKTLAPDLPEADLLLDGRDRDDWGRRMHEALAARKKKAKAFVPAASARLLSTGPSYAWLKISDGCRHACAFCTIPGIRGPLVSSRAELLEEEAKGLPGQGVRELVVVAQDVTAWGSDFRPRQSLPRLLERLLPLAGLERLRLLYLYPAGLTGELLHFLQAAGPPFVPYFDVPLQHAAHGVLARMGRPFAGAPGEVVERIRSVFPQAALRTGLIVGFPGESEADFLELCDFVEQTRFHHLGVFAYQAEEGTAAALMPGQIERAEKERRREHLMALQARISEELLLGCVGGRERVLVDAPHPDWPGLHVGRTWFQAPEIDGVTYISGPGTAPGRTVEADITESTSYDLVALTDAEE